MAAQAYSPSDAMSQARFCLDGMRKVQRAGDEFGGAICPAETGPCRRRICSRGWGGPPDFPRRRGPRRIAPCGGVVWRGGGPLHPSSCISKMPARLAEPARLKTKAACGSCGLLFLARWIRLPRRHMGPRRRVRPDRLRHPRGLRGAAEAQQPWERDAMLLKHRQGGLGEGNLYMHVAMHSVRVLTDSSGETASTSKILSDVTRVSICGWTGKR